MKLTIPRVIPLVLVLDVALFAISGIGSVKHAKHGADYWIGEVDWLAFLIGALALVVLVAVALYRRGARRRGGVWLAAILVLAVAGTANAAKQASVQSVHVTLGSHGPVLSGATRWRPGLVRIVVMSKLPDQDLTLLRFRPGYSYADFLADGKLARGRGAASRAAIEHVFAHTIFAGGVDLFPGESASVTVDATPGTYYLGEMTDRPQLTRIRVAGASARGTLHPTASITATNDGFRVSGPLPASGAIGFVNDSSRPHRVNLIPVEAGTTRAQVLAYIRGTGGPTGPPPPFALKGAQLGTADLSPHRRMELRYRLPAGTYAAVDFDRDMHTGRPEALEGLVAVVRLR